MKALVAKMVRLTRIRLRRSAGLYASLVIWMVTFGSSAQAVETPEKSWTDAIASVERFRAEVESRLHKWENPGTAMNEVDVPAHRCSILGRMLEKPELIKSIEVDYSNIGNSNYDISVALISLDNWLINARGLLSATREERVRTWNLDCVGKMGIPATAFIQETGPPTFYTVTNDGKVLRILGDVESGFADRIAEALNRNPDITTIALGSAGGYIREAIQAGLLIRRMHLDTVLWNDCMSACSLVFIAGVQRTIWSPYPRLGFHRVSQDGVAVSLYDPVYELIARYVLAMGVNSKFVLKAMVKARPEDMHYPDGEFLCDGAIITWMQRAYTNCP